VKGKRKPPKPHTVHTKDPRYNVNQYPRGSCGGAPRYDGSGGSVGNHPNAKVIQGIRQLSAGTIANLTRKRNYSEIDAEREKFARWVERSNVVFDSWRDAWDWYTRGRTNKRLQKSVQSPDKIIYRGNVYTWASSSYGYMNREVAERMAEHERAKGRKALVRKVTGTNPPFKGQQWYMVYRRETPASIRRLFSDEGARRRAMERHGLNE